MMPRRLCVLCALICGLALLGGCKTSEDARAAASQMSATAQALIAYYRAQERILAETDAVHLVNEQLYAKPYPNASRVQMKETEKELEIREAMARDLSILAASFGRLTDSTAAEDTAASAVALQGDLDTMAEVKASAGEQNLLKAALGALVTAIQEKKEREAAKAMDQVAQRVAELFKKEAQVWTSADVTYAELAATLANGLVDANALDNSVILKGAIAPYGLGLEPAASTPGLNQKLAPIAKLRIADQKLILEDGYKSAALEMEQALAEMARRVHTVATEKPMKLRNPPLTVGNVEKWAAEVATF